MGNHFGKNLSALPKVQEYPTSVGCIYIYIHVHVNGYKLSVNTLA